MLMSRRVLWGAAATLVAIQPVLASGTISKADAQKRVSAIEASDAEFLAKFPMFAVVSDAVKGDCAQKVPEFAKSQTFCSCAASITMELWRSGADPKMMQRLSDYASNPNSSKPSDFLQYQGPELYRPICELAEP